jgi:hypothetical protein
VSNFNLLEWKVEFFASIWIFSCMDSSLEDRDQSFEFYFDFEELVFRFEQSINSLCGSNETERILRTIANSQLCDQ